MKNIRGVCCAVSFALICGAVVAMAQNVPEIALTKPSEIVQPDVSNDASLKVIFSNLGPAGKTYAGGSGYYVAGDDWCGGGGCIQWMAMPFTPKENATVTEIQVAVAYDGAGVNGFYLVLASDASGFPGKSIHTWGVSNLPAFGSCCKLDTVRTQGIKVKKGTRYWLIAKASGKYAWSLDVWDLNWYGQNGYMAWTTDGKTWKPYAGTMDAFAVKGHF